MKYECDLIRDIMPLCADGLAAEASRRAVEQHIAECAECAKEWENMTGTIKTYTAAPIQLDETKTYAKTARKVKRFRAVMLFLAVGIPICFGSSYYRWKKQAGIYLTSPEQAALTGAALGQDIENAEILGKYEYANSTYDFFVKGEKRQWDSEKQEYGQEYTPVIALVGVARSKDSYWHWAYASASGVFLADDPGVVLHNSVQSMFLPSDTKPVILNLCYATDPAVDHIRLTAYGETKTQQVNENRLCVFEYKSADPKEYYGFSGQAYAADGTVLYELTLQDYEYIWEKQ